MTCLLNGLTWYYLHNKFDKQAMLGSMGWYWHDPFQLDKKKYDKKWLTNFYLHKLQLLQTNKFTNCIS